VHAVQIYQLYLLGGLALHKLVWEALRRRDRAPAVASSRPAGALAQLARLAKLAILAGIVVQVFLPDLLPIARGPERVRALGLALFTAGLATALLGRLQLGDSWSDIEAGEVSPDHRLVERGVYRYLRHPIYAGDLLLLLGLELALNSWLVAAVPALAVAVFWQARREERILEQSVSGYREYRRRTKGFIPFVL
jgi:protein-S-isoprenylcysteine O-methyltransferase Ste14